MRHRTATLAACLIAIAVASVGGCAGKDAVSSARPRATSSTTPGPTFPVPPSRPISSSTTVAASCPANSFRITPDPIPVSADTTQVDVTVCWNSAASVSKRIFLIQCRSDPSAAGFEWSRECAALTEILANPSPEASGLKSFSVFVGQEPSGDERWGCYPPGVTPAAPIVASPRCWLRFTFDSEDNTAGVLSAPISFAAT